MPGHMTMMLLAAVLTNNNKEESIHDRTDKTT